ncbi:MAG: DNA repair ATPase [unclassified Hahellaceae]|nr:DNA repair ATPase [Hahellaceae bacterium]|tara:strand:- start:8485 stop:9870 length:1386 start_codon:yes stop_codon:yes gene_type:complete
MPKTEMVNGFEAVLFLEDQYVVRQMRFAEFEAVLDGVVSMPDLADAESFAVYAVMDEQLQVRATVFFKIYFDEDGRADPEWNLPLRRLARIAGPGPDLGAGPIRLACRSQCPISWHLADLWDPDMRPGGNDFQVIRKAIKDNRLGFDRVAEGASGGASGLKSGGYRELPVHDQFSDADSQELSDEDALSLSDELQATPERDGTGVDHRTRLARLLRDQRLRIKALSSQHESEIGDLVRAQRLEQQAHKNRTQVLEQKLQQVGVLSDQLKARLKERGEQVLKLQATVDELKQQMRLLQKQVAAGAVSGKAGGADEDRNASRLRAELSIVKEQLQRREAELQMRSEREDQLIAELQSAQAQVEDHDEMEIVTRLSELDVVFVVYHPGAGHLTLPAADLKIYSEKPLAYAASRCFVTEQNYKHWLEHYETPLCEVCGKTVERITVPADYEHGEDNRCEAHKVEL